jgi:hypothetical protein
MASVPQSSPALLPGQSTGSLQPLHTQVGCSVAALNIVEQGRQGWLPTSEVHSLMRELCDWDVGWEALQPVCPAGALLAGWGVCVQDCPLWHAAAELCTRRPILPFPLQWATCT